MIKFQGNGHVVFNGSFFYYPEGKDFIVRYDLQDIHKKYTKELRLPGFVPNSKNYLYTPDNNYNYVDFEVDENGKNKKKKNI